MEVSFFAGIIQFKFFFSGTSRCGGSWVNEWYVITAGHCVARSVNRPSQVRITLGEYYEISNVQFYFSLYFPLFRK